MIPCEACEDGDHSECTDPVDTAMEWDTGYWYVTQCCDAPEPDPDEERWS